jgi:hypothetical protein
MKKRNILPLICFCLIATACKSDPYEGTPNTDLAKINNKPDPAPVTTTSTTTTTSTSTTTTTMAPSISLVVPDVMTTHEGDQVVIPIQSFVPAPGIAQYQFQGMPLGMSFDAAKSEIRWTPDLLAANDASDSSVMTKNYVIFVTLRSSTDPLRTITKHVVIAVIDKKVRSLMNWQRVGLEDGVEVYQRCDQENCEQWLQPVRGQNL